MRTEKMKKYCIVYDHIQGKLVSPIPDDYTLQFKLLTKNNQEMYTGSVNPRLINLMDILKENRQCSKLFIYRRKKDGSFINDFNAFITRKIITPTNSIFNKKRNEMPSKKRFLRGRNGIVKRKGGGGPDHNEPCEDGQMGR